MKRTISILLIAALALSLAACTTPTGDPQTSSAPPAETSSAPAETKDAPPAESTEPAASGELFSDAPLASITPVDKLPLPAAKIDKAQYAYDDMSKKVDVEIMTYFYGVADTVPDPIGTYLGEKYNANIKLSTFTETDTETIISTRFAAQDYPTAMVLGAGRKNIIQTLWDQGQLMDGEQVLRYMPNFAQYYTKEYQQFGTYKGSVPAIPRYNIQGEWGPFLRSDWLEKLGMEMPKTLDDLTAYAKAVTFDDPDGNGQADTWFAGGAGKGEGFGMLDSLQNFFGYSGYSVVDGKINHPYLDDTTKNWLTYIKMLNDEKVLAPDWYTIDWEGFKSYSLNYKVGYVNYPATNLHMEQLDASGGENWHVWTAMTPVGTGKNSPAPGPSMLYAWPKSAGDNPDALKRVCHILDELVWNGDDYWNAIQGGGNDVFGKEVFKIIDNNDGTFSFYVDRATHPAWDGTLDTTGLANCGWQNIGLANSPYQYNFVPENEEVTKAIAEDGQKLAAFDKWPNNFVVQIDPDVTSDLTEFTKVEIPKFVFGERKLEEWDKFVQEWLDKGGEKALVQAAEQMGCSR